MPKWQAPGPTVADKEEPALCLSQGTLQIMLTCKMDQNITSLIQMHSHIGLKKHKEVSVQRDL